MKKQGRLEIRPHFNRMWNEDFAVAERPSNVVYGIDFSKGTDDELA